jgi:hypothetical protein
MEKVRSRRASLGNFLFGSGEKQQLGSLIRAEFKKLINAVYFA